MFMVFVGEEGAFTAPNHYFTLERHAVERARQIAREGQTARVFKVVETHYYEANYHQKVNM